MESILQERKCMYCGQPVPNRGEGYYDHLRASKECEAAWREWREELDQDRKSGG